jgi:uncharacterized membrane protein
MGEPQTVWDDKRLEIILGKLLRAGVIMAATVVTVGGLLYLFRYGDQYPNYRVFRGQPDSLRNVSGIVKAALSLQTRAIIQLGLLLLIATPVARVAFSVLAFARERDRTYVAITIIVLTVLLYSLLANTP